MEDEEMVETTPLGDEDVVLRNEPQGADVSLGGGEFPDPDAPPSGLAPADGSPTRGKGQFDEAYAAAGSEAAGVGALADSDAEEVEEEPEER